MIDYSTVKKVNLKKYKSYMPYLIMLTSSFVSNEIKNDKQNYHMKNKDNCTLSFSHTI